MNSDNLGQLKGMFPSLDEGIISAVLSETKDIDKAIEALLAMNTTSLSEEEKKRVKDQVFSEVINKVMRMVNERHARDIAGKFGLDIGTVAWEDNGRTKGSCWGPCISDMTLVVRDNALPLVRYPNFEDLTWDVPMEKIPLVVGNEIGGKLYTISLKEYLEHFRMYLNKAQSWKGQRTSLLAPERDSHVIMSAQACFLPVPKGDEAVFNVSIYNYQSVPGDPAVLAITATSQGTSAQIIENTGWAGQKLYFNKNGERASFIGQRLSDNRKERGVSTTGAMTQQEKQQNMVMVIQVPLKQKNPGGRMLMMPDCCVYESEGCLDYDDDGCEEDECEVEKADVEDAIIKIGEAEGEFREIGDLEIERDPQFPVRVTLQYYKSTANGVVDEESMRTIAKQIEESRKFADFVGSLVVSGDTGRPTEMKLMMQQQQFIPDWWTVFWLTYGPNYQSLGEEAAKQILFPPGDRTYASSTFNDVKSLLLGQLDRASNNILNAPFVVEDPGYNVDPYLDYGCEED